MGKLVLRTLINAGALWIAAWLLPGITVLINAAMLWLTAWLSEFTPILFTIDSFFFTAVWASVIVSVISLFKNRLTRKREHRSFQNR